MSYATGADLVLRFDARTLGDMIGDGESVEEDDVPTHPVVTMALEDASGDIDMALKLGNRYSASDLANLTGTSLASLKRVTCEIALSHLLKRRIGRAEEYEAQRKLAETTLERLRKGDIVFDLQPQQEAGLADSPTFIQADADQSTLLRDRVHNYYPRRHLPTVR